MVTKGQEAEGEGGTCEGKCIGKSNETNFDETGKLEQTAGFKSKVEKGGRPNWKHMQT